MRAQPPIVVAVPDGDDEALLRFAAWEALTHGCAIHLVHVRPDRGGADAGRVLAAAIARTEVLAGPGVMVTGEALTGRPVGSVLCASGGALVVAVRQRDALHLMRTIEEDGRRDGDPPIVCVPSSWAPTTQDERPVLVGVGDPDHARGLISRALEIARAHGTSVRVVHAWRFHRQYDDLIDARIGGRWNEDVQAALVDVVTRCRSEADPRAAALPVDIVVEHGHPADVLIAAARQAQSLVIQRNCARDGSEHLGRTTRTALHQCPCPVVLLPAPRRGDDQHTPPRRSP